MARFNSDGTLDATFGNQGKVTTDIDNGGGDNVAKGLAVDPVDGSIVVVGHSNSRYEGRDCVAIISPTIFCDDISVSHWDTAIARYDVYGNLLWDKKEDFTAANKSTSAAIAT